MLRIRRLPDETPHQHRIRSYLERHPGETRQQARGHAGAVVRETTAEKLERARQDIAAGVPLATAARRQRVAPERLRQSVRAAPAEFVKTPRGWSTVRREFKSRLFELFPNARQHPEAFNRIDALSAAAVAELASLSDADLNFLIRRRDDFNDAFTEFTRSEPEVPYTTNPLWYHGSRTITGVNA
jgi:hypothetical protein